jgi:hypothetical protein
MRTLLLNPPSCGGFDRAAGPRHQARREIRSFRFPTWPACPSGLIPESRLSHGFRLCIGEAGEVFSFRGKRKEVVGSP